MAHQDPHCLRCGAITTLADVEGRARPVCTACGQAMFLDPKLAVTVVIEQAGSILLGLRGEGTREPGKWSFPAGFVDRGERVEAAAAREVREETGIEIRDVHLLDLLSRDGEAVVLAVYVAESFGGHPRAQDDLVDVGWFDPHDPPPLAFPHDGGIIESWLRWRRKTGRSDNS